MVAKTKSAAQILEEASKTFRERNAVYGDNYIRAAGALQAMFPNGITLKTQEDHERMQIFSLIFVKLSRYAVQWDQGFRHKDSIHDTSVYAALLEAIDFNQEAVEQELSEAFIKNEHR